MSLVGETTALPPATYEIVLELDGLPFHTVCRSGEERGCEAVDGPAGTSVDLDVDINVTANDTIWVWGTAPDEELLPADYRLVVVTEGVSVIEEAGEFDYEDSSPNGPDCGPTCSIAPLLEFTAVPLG